MPMLSKDWQLLKKSLDHVGADPIHSIKERIRPLQIGMYVFYICILMVIKILRRTYILIINNKLPLRTRR